MGSSRHTLGGEIMKNLLLPKVQEFMEDARAGDDGSSGMVRTGLYLTKWLNSQANFRYFT